MKALLVGETRDGKLLESPYELLAFARRIGADAFAKVQLLNMEFFQKNCAVLVKQSLKHEGIDAEE